ncbi:MAG TPA: hypothetical protein VFM18_18160 [Methanosarcina sp.]|nr:hypothetical protein [Methanosarcina sp.]
MIHNPCYEFWKQEDGNSGGSCCCNCNWQRPVTAHPWNKGMARGSILEIIGYGCTCPPFFPEITFFEKEHGMCELWEKRSWPEPSQERILGLLKDE